MRQLSDPLRAKRLYITDLAERIEAMEAAGSAIPAAAYRLFTRRLQAAMAGYPEAQLSRQLGGLHTAVTEALEYRRFEMHGCFDGPAAEAAQCVCDALLWRLSAPTA